MSEIDFLFSLHSYFINAEFSRRVTLRRNKPTNHLDIKTKDILKDALLSFDGTLILVSHDRDFLDGLANKVFEFGNKRVREHFEDINGFLRNKKIENLKEIERTAKA